MNATCSDVLKLLSDYVDDALPPGVRQGADEHMLTCLECVTALREIRCARRLLRKLPREPMPDPMKNTLLDALRARTSPRTYPPAPIQPHHRPNPIGIPQQRPYAEPDSEGSSSS